MKPARIDNLVLDANDPEAIVAFWCALLGYHVLDRLGDGQFIEVGDPTGHRISIILQRVRESKVVKNRMHMDIEVEDLEAATTEVQRLGGSWVDEIEREEHGFRWRIVADPEGNEFCIFPARS